MNKNTTNNTERQDRGAFEIKICPETIGWAASKSLLFIENYENFALSFIEHWFGYTMLGST